MCQVVSGLQVEFTRPGEDDGRAWDRTGAHNDSAVRATVRSGIREALESVRTVRWRLMACDETYITVKGRFHRPARSRTSVSRFGPCDHAGSSATRVSRGQPENNSFLAPHVGFEAITLR